MKGKIAYWKKRFQDKDPVIIYALLTFLNDLAFAMIGPIYVLFLSNFKLDEVQITSINTVYMLSVFLLEVPTGTIADAYGRKASSVIGWTFRALGFFMYSYADTFVWFAISEAITAIGTACISGALNAWLRESTDDDGYLNVISKTSMYSKMITLGISGFAGILASKFGFNFIWQFGGISFLMSMLLGAKLMKRDRPSERLKTDKRGLELTLEVLKTSGRTIKYSSPLKLMLIAGFITMASFQSLNMFWSLKFTKMFDSIEIAGPLFSIMMLGMMIGNGLARSNHLKRRHDSESLIFIAIFIGITIFCSAISSSAIIALIAFVLHEIGRGSLKILQESFLQKYLPESARSALSSLSSMSTTLGSSFGLIISGQIASKFSIETAWMFSALTILLLIPIYARIKKSER